MSKKRLRPHEWVDPLEDSYATQLAEWKAVREQVSRAMRTPFDGMIAEVDAALSFRDHRAALETKGYAFGAYNTDRSLFEKLERLVFRATPDAHMGREVFKQAKGLLLQVHEGARPQRNSFSALVMMSTEYVPPLSDLVHLLAHPRAASSDLELFWELTDRIWCFAHPVYELHSGYLDETCGKITRRLAEIGATDIQD